MQSWTDDDPGLSVYRRAFDLMELDPDPDTDGYLPANTAGFPPRSRVWPLPAPLEPLEPHERRDVRLLRQERDDLKAALRDALMRERGRATLLMDARIGRDRWRVVAIALAVILVLHMLVR